MSTTTVQSARAVTRTRHTAAPPPQSPQSAPPMPWRLSLLDAVREQFLQVRRIYLRHKRPASPRVDCWRRDFACGKIRALENLVACSSADLADGAPLEAVLRPWYSIIALLEEEARERDASRTQRTHEPFSLIPLHVAETRAQAALDEAQLRAIAEPENREALAAVEQRVTEYLPKLRAIADAVRRKLAQSRALEPAR